MEATTATAAGSVTPAAGSAAARSSVARSAAAVPDRRPIPAPSPLTAPYWEACRRGELAIQRCAGCRRFVHFPEAACPFCGGADLPYETVSGRGTVHTFTVVHRTFLPGFTPPYVVAWIDLDEGARAFGDVVHCAPEDVRIGLPVRVCFDDPADPPAGPAEADEAGGAGGPGTYSGPLPHWRPR